MVGFSLAKPVTDSFLSTFPDRRVTYDDVFAQGDKVAVCLTCRGTHKGEFVKMRKDLKPATMQGGSSAGSFARSAGPPTSFCTRPHYPSSIASRAAEDHLAAAGGQTQKAAVGISPLPWLGFSPSDYPLLVGRHSGACHVHCSRLAGTLSCTRVGSLYLANVAPSW